MNRLVTLLFLLLATQISAQSIQWLSACSSQNFCVDVNSCTQGHVFLTELAATNCNTSQDISYYYKIDLQGDGSIDIQAEGDTVSGTFPKGTHRITWRATDNCGHANTCSYSIVVKDCTPPNIVCLNGSTQTLDAPDCMVTFTARQFILSAVDNCTPSNQIQFGIRKLGTGTGFPTDSTVTFQTCDQGLHTLEIWSKDLNGLTNQCNSYVLVQDGNGGCACVVDADVTATGCVRTTTNTKISDYHVRLKVESVGGTGNQVTKNVVKYMTDSCFSIAALKLPLARNYLTTVRAERFFNPLNGVSTFDLVQISKHILGVTPFTNVYQGIAADVNNSHTITALDIIETRKLILGIYDSFPGVPSWRLVRPVANPANFSLFTAIKDTYQIVVPNLSADVALSTFPFVAVKMGDVNASALPFGGEAESRGAALLLQIANLYVEAGEEITVPIRLRDAATLAGWQIALRTDPTALQITGVEGLSEEDYLRAADGSLRALWFDGHEREFSAGEVVFTLKIKALRAFWLQQALTVDRREMLPEAYADNTARRPLELNFTAPSTVKTAFFPPQPNPFAEETTLQYQLEQPGEAMLEIFDAAGQLVHHQTVKAVTGLNTLFISASTLPNSGVYAFRLWADGQVFSGRLVRM